MSKEELIDDESMTASQEVQLMNVIIPLDDCLDCRVQMIRCQIDLSKTDKEEDVDESEESTWSWEEYFDLFSTADPSIQQDEEQDPYTIAVYDEYDLDPAIFLNANMYWIPR